MNSFFFFLKTLNVFAHFMMDDLGAYLPTHNALSVQQFLTKNDMTPLPHPSYLPKQLFFLYPWMKKALKGKCPCGRGETKNSRNTKRHQNQGVQKLC